MPSKINPEESPMSLERSVDAPMPRRDFLKLSAAGVGGLAAVSPGDALAAQTQAGAKVSGRVGRNFNSCYEGEYLNQVAFPLGGIGAGMICLEGTGALS